MQNAVNKSESQTTFKESTVIVKVEVASETEQKTIGDELKTCRVCLKEGNFNFPIYGEGFSDLSADLSNFGGIIVRRGDAYPKYLCQACHSILHSAILFRKTAQRSDEILRKTTKQNNHVNIKKEAFTTPDVATKHNTNLNVKQELEIEFENSNHSSNNEEDNNVNVEYIIEKKNERNFYKKPSRCEKCNLNFETVKDYLKHRSTDEHKKQKKPKATCSICKKTICQSNLEQHKLLHGKEPSFICDVCGKSFKKRTQLTKHHMTHSFDLQFKCSLCPYKGRFKQCLELHMLIHTGEKPYTCSLCPSRFSHRSNLNKHLRSHRGIRDFKCDQCTRDFYTKPELELHFRADHLGIKDFECETCGKAFGSRRRLMKHQLKVHKREKRRIGRVPVYLLAEEIKKTE